MGADKDPNAEEQQAGSQHTRNRQAQRNMREKVKKRVMSGKKQGPAKELLAGKTLVTVLG